MTRNMIASHKVNRFSVAATRAAPGNSRVATTTTSLIVDGVRKSIVPGASLVGDYSSSLSTSLTPSSDQAAQYRRSYFTSTPSMVAAASQAMAMNNEASTTRPSSSSSGIKAAPNVTERKQIIPTRHSMHFPEDICTDPVELGDLTQKLLDQKPGNSGYQYDGDLVALDRHRQKILYVVRGHSSNIPNTLYSRPDSSNASMVSSVGTIIDILVKAEEEDDAQRELFMRRQQVTPPTYQFDDVVTKEDEAIEIGSSTFGEVDDMFSSIIEHKHQHEQELEQQDTAEDSDFLAIERAMSKLGHTVDGEGEMDESKTSISFSDNSSPIDAIMTVAMYETLLDALAGASQSMVTSNDEQKDDVESLLQNEMLRPSSVLEMVKLTIERAKVEDPASIVTYNAALRTIMNLGRFYNRKEGGHSSSSFSRYRDEVLHAGLGVYNLLTHNPFGVKRNAQSIKYLLLILEQTIPPSRVRGNMSVTLWHQASREGVVTPSLVECFLGNIHGVSNIRDTLAKISLDTESVQIDSINGPEFGVFSQKLLATLEPRTNRMQTDGSDDEIDKSYNISPARFARFAKKYAHSHPARLY